MARMAILLVALVASFILAASCVADRGESIRVENRTDRPVDVLEDGILVSAVQPSSTGRYAIIAGFNGTLRYEVRDREGVVLAERSFTWAEIDESNGYRIVIE